MFTLRFTLSAFRILPIIPHPFPQFSIPHFTFRIPHSAIPHFTNDLDYIVTVSLDYHKATLIGMLYAV